ncbi:MAG: glycosyltransferase [Lachnospiraceae bacterium]|nr:glycosyltransferase [Lachnospiraceae bacterium]
MNENDGGKLISICLPCYNEIGNIRPMYESITKVMVETGYRYEIIFTDNCSTDGTRELLREIAKTDDHVKALFNSRNYGVDGRSGRNTMKYVSGEVMIALAADFQDPPELIPEFIKHWEAGYKVVCGQKVGSEEGRLKYSLRHLYYRIIRLISDIPQYEHISGITLMDREVLDEFQKTDYDYYFRFALADMGYTVKLIQYKQQARKSGKSSYNVWRSLSFSINSMVTTSTVPLRLMTVLGIVLSFITFIIGLFYLVFKLRYWNTFNAGSAPILIGVFFIGSIQLFFLGIIGEYIGVILRKVTRQPDVILSEKIGFDS